jgi:hypothetical protein
MAVRTSTVAHRLSAGLAAIAIAILHPQELPSQPAYQYDVVSIRRADPGEMNSGFSPGAHAGMRARNVTGCSALTGIG